MDTASFLDCELVYDSIRNRIYMRDPKTGLYIWDDDPGSDATRFEKVKATFFERLNYWATANLWVVPANISWADTKYKTVKAPTTYKTRRMVCEDMYWKLKHRDKDHPRTAKGNG